MAKSMRTPTEEKVGVGCLIVKSGERGKNEKIVSRD